MYDRRWEIMVSSDPIHESAWATAGTTSYAVMFGRELAACYLVQEWWTAFHRVARMFAAVVEVDVESLYPRQAPKSMMFVVNFYICWWPIIVVQKGVAIILLSEPKNICICVHHKTRDAWDWFGSQYRGSRWRPRRMVNVTWIPSREVVRGKVR